MGAHKQTLLSDPYNDPYEGAMQFRLTYEGVLLGGTRSSTRSSHKHDIRKKLSPQIKALWEKSAWLSELQSLRFPDLETAFSGQSLRNHNWRATTPYLELLAAHYQRANRTWLPLVAEGMNLTCGVDILFLRPGARGGVVNVGDIDGRLKVLFDALAVPRDGGGLPTEPEQEPIYTLLSDDSLISHVSVETDELLAPVSEVPNLNDARVIFTVNIKPLTANFLTVGFSSF
jgi:hypothetical protein